MISHSLEHVLAVGGGSVELVGEAVSVDVIPEDDQALLQRLLVLYAIALAVLRRGGGGAAPIGLLRDGGGGGGPLL